MLGTVDLGTLSNVVSIVGGISGILIVVIVPLFRRGIKQVKTDLYEAIDDRVTPPFSQIMDMLSSMQNKLSSVQGEVFNHEKRISKLEGIQEGKASMKGGGSQ